MSNKLKKLQKEAPQEIPKFMEALKLSKELNGISISADQATFKKVKQALAFIPSTDEGKELKRNMMANAKHRASQGMLGEGVFLID